MKNLFLTTLTVLGMSLSARAQLPVYVPANGLIGWWPFNGNANDESGMGNNGVVTGAVLSVDRSGVANKAYSFNGTSSNYITVAASNLPLSNSDISISAWFNTSIFPVNSSLAVLSWGQWTTNEARYIGLRQNSNNTITYAQYYNDIDCTFNYSLNTWYHYVVTCTGGIVKFYINGILLGTFNVSSANTQPGSLFFGTTPGSSDFFSGSLDDIGIWNRALDSAEVRKLYNAKTIFAGLNSISLDDKVNVFPNPASEHLTIDFGNYKNFEGHYLKITNSSGQQVFETVITQAGSQIELSNWPGKGLYLIQITNSNGAIVENRKVIIE